MKTRYNVGINNVLIYTILIFVSSYLAYWVSIAFAYLLRPLSGKVPLPLLAIFVFSVDILLGFAIPLIAIFFYFKSTVGKQYIPSEDKFSFIKSCTRLVLPAEIVRYIACQITLGHVNTTGPFAFLPTVLFENTYMIWFDRSEWVRQRSFAYNFADFMSYALCYMIYVAIHLLLVLIIYRYFWLKAKKDREDLIIS